jgi:hypothetical protein
VPRGKKADGSPQAAGAAELPRGAKRSTRGARKRKETADPVRPPSPGPDGATPLHELARDPLSVFLFVALVPDETRALVKELGLSVPGFRTDALGDVQRCDVLADEIRARPEVGERVLQELRRAFGRLALHSAALDATAADDLLATAGTEDGLPLALWRVLADPDAAVRARAVPVLEQLAKEYYGPPPEGAAGGDGTAAPEGPPPDGEAAARARVAELEKALERAEQRAESVRKKGEEQREKLQEWLKEARARAAQATDEAARAREVAQTSAAARERAEAALAAAQTTDAAAEAQRARAAARELGGKLAGLEARLERQKAREEELEEALAKADARARNQPAPAPASEGVIQDEAEDSQEEAATWLRPIYTREFYDSLEGWDLRIQRAAFKQANLLAIDHRHPSLRALPLEGLPGYYRVRVATDVRLLYRRGERQNEIEILSLIDREDLDRYVRQAKTR